MEVKSDVFVTQKKDVPVRTIQLIAWSNCVDLQGITTPVPDGCGTISFYGDRLSIYGTKYGYGSIPINTY